MWFLGVAFHILLIIPLTVRILLRDDISAPARLAWFMVITLFPYLGAVIYLLFGEARFGNKRQQAKRLVFAQVMSAGQKWTGDPNLCKAVGSAYSPLSHYATSVNGFSPVGHNSIQLMFDEIATIDNMIDDIDAATTHVHVLYYIWLPDKTGARMSEALIRAAKRGVTCRVMVDGLGSRLFLKTPLWKNMTDAGIHTQVALSIEHPLRTILFNRIDLRNHRKITVIDNRITYCGSQNCADTSFFTKPKYAPWVDIMYRITGPVVTQNQLLFATDWLFYRPGDSLDEFLTPQPDQFENGCLAQIIGFGPTVRAGASSQLFTTAISNAKKSLTITTPYFVPDMEILSSLMAACYRGVNVTMIVPARNDSWVVAAASHSHYRRLLEAGVELYEYQPGLLHAKTLTIDGATTIVGSTNLDLRSFDLNYENNVIFYDANITTETEARQSAYKSCSKAVTLKDVKNWSIPRRLWNNAVATVGPIL